MTIPVYNKHGEVARAIVSDEDAWLAEFRWHRTRTGYVCRHGPRQSGKPREMIYMHRLVLGLVRGDGLEADHKNRNKLDNRRENLRITNRRGNCQNVDRPSTLGFRGVYKHHNRYIARVMHHKQLLYLGCYRTPEEAAQVAADKRRELGFLEAA